MTKNYTQDILNKVNTLKPKPKWHFYLINGVFGALILLTIFISALLLAGFIDDSSELINLQTNFDLPVNYLSDPLLEFLFIAVFGCFLIYFIYRQTDWIFVRQGKFLATTIILLILIFGGVTAYSGGKENLEKVSELAEILPNRQNRKQVLLEKLQERNIFVGEVIGFKESKSGWEYTLKSPLKTETFTSSRKYRRVEIGSRVVIKYEQKENFKNIIRLRVVNRN